MIAGLTSVLSGTPVQNDLGEYWAMVSLPSAIEQNELTLQSNFVNPGILGLYSQFNRQYEKPIMRSRAQNCPKKELEEGRERALDVGRLHKCDAQCWKLTFQLAELATKYVLRRDARVLENYLPPKRTTQP